MLDDLAEVALPLASWALLGVPQALNVETNRAVIATDQFTAAAANCTLLLGLFFRVSERHRERLVGPLGHFILNLITLP